MLYPALTSHESDILITDPSDQAFDLIDKKTINLVSEYWLVNSVITQVLEKIMSRLIYGQTETLMPDATN